MSFVLGAVVGGAIGAAAAALFGSRRGSELRAEISAWRERNTTGAGEGPGGAVSEALDLGAALLQSGRGRLKDAFDAARSAAAEARVRLLEDFRKR